MIRLALLLAALATPGAAWEFSPSPICTLRSTSGDTETEVTYDGALYRIRLTHADGWPDSPIFSIRFAPTGPFISTDRHIVDGSTLEVSDTGFGNVLNGLQFNQSASALLDGLSREIDLTGAADPVAEFRDCKPLPLS